jgi:hypothetical protein
MCVITERAFMALAGGRPGEIFQRPRKSFVEGAAPAHGRRPRLLQAAPPQLARIWIGVEEEEPEVWDMGTLQMLDRLQQGICALRGHDLRLRFETNRLSLRCANCGWDTPGWSVASRAARAVGTDVRDARIHKSHMSGRSPYDRSRSATAR